MMSKDDVDFRRIAATNATVSLNKISIINYLIIPLKDSLKRSSKDSGFDSPQATSPSPNGIVVTSSTYLTATSPKRSGVEQVLEKAKVMYQTRFL